MHKKKVRLFRLNQADLFVQNQYKTLKIIRYAADKIKLAQSMIFTKAVLPIPRLVIKSLNGLPNLSRPKTSPNSSRAKSTGTKVPTNHISIRLNPRFGGASTEL